MTAGGILVAALLTMAVILLGLTFAAMVRRTSRDLLASLRNKREARIRPMLLSVVTDDEPDLSFLRTFSKKDLRIVESLIWGLLSKVRGSSKQVLVKWLVESGAIGRVCEQTKSRSRVKRARSVELLGSSGIAETASFVADCLHDSDKEVRSVAARALGKFSEKEAVVHLLSALTGPKAIPRSIISMSLLHVGPQAIEPLMDGLLNRSALVRSVCVDMLGIYGAVKATDRLIGCLQLDPSMKVRVSAAGALGRLGSPKGVEPLVRCITVNAPRKLRVAAVASIGQIGGKQAISWLNSAMLDVDSVVSAAAVEALSKMGDEGCIILTELSTMDLPQSLIANQWLSRREINLSSRKRSSREMAGA